MLTLDTRSVQQRQQILRKSGPVQLDRAARAPVDAAARLVADASAGDAAVYGVNTGFGKLANRKIAARDTATLQRNLVRSHSAGVGDALAPPLVRLMMALKLLSLGRGASGVRWRVIEQIEHLLAKGVTPVIPVQGSVGASGDLAPLAHMAATLIGEGEAIFQSRRQPSTDALSAAGLEPLALGPKEGLALINGTQFSTACALGGLFAAWRNASASLVTASLSTDAIMGSTAPLNAELHRLRGHAGQIAVATEMRALMQGSQIRESHRTGDARVQDPYCIRCQPQVVGACVDLLRTAGRTLQIEANAVTDNPLVLVDQGRIVSGGNFHGEPVAFAADQIALAVAEIGAIAQRRVALMVDPTLSYDLPPFLTPDPGLNSGFMIAEVMTAALMCENKHLANPCSTDSTPTSANQEDHVSMAAHGAYRLARMNRNLNAILGVELLAACQGIEFRAPLLTSPRLQAVLARRRADADRRPLHGPGYRARNADGGHKCGVRNCRRAVSSRRPMNEFIEVSPGQSPVVLAMPHTGTQVPADVWDGLNDNGRALADTDWNIHRLYGGLLDGATTVRTTIHRYAIDANRAPDGASLYPGQNTTGLCPITDFDGQPIYRSGREPAAAEIAKRCSQYHVPYHTALNAELARVQAIHGVVVLFDCHSIRSHVPYLFDGKLSDYNIGANGGTTCASAVQIAVQSACENARGYSTVVNGRFKGGWTTRHYGDPEHGVHAIQMELAQSTYMTESPPWTYDEHRADRLREYLKAILRNLHYLARQGDLT